MAFAQFIYRESLRDIEACLSAEAAKRYHIGFRQPISRSTLADANESRDWGIYAEFAQMLITEARRLYAETYQPAGAKRASDAAMLVVPLQTARACDLAQSRAFSLRGGAGFTLVLMASGCNEPTCRSSSMVLP